MLSRRALALALPSLIIATEPRAWTHGLSYPWSEDAQQIFNRLVTPPDNTTAARYAARVDYLRSKSTLPKLDTLCFFDLAATKANSLVNMVDTGVLPALYAPGEESSFIPGLGWSGVGVNSNISLGFNPAVDVGNYTRESASLFCKTTTPTKQATVLMGVSGNGKIQLWPLYPDDKTYWSINTDGAESNVVLGTDASGSWVLNRTADTVQELWHDKIKVDHNAIASAPPENGLLRVPFGPYRVQIAASGGGLTSDDIAALHDIGSL